MSWRIIVDYHKLNLVDKVTCPVDMSESLSSATSIHRQYGLTNKAAMVTPMEVTHGVSNGLHAWSPIWLLPLQSAEFANNLLNNDLASFSRGIIQLPGGSLFTLEHVHHGRSRYILNGIETLSECRFASGLMDSWVVWSFFGFHKAQSGLCQGQELYDIQASRPLKSFPLQWPFYLQVTCIKC